MSAQSAVGSKSITESRESWVPMIAIALGQVLMSFNVASLPVALSGMVNSFGVPPAVRRVARISRRCRSVWSGAGPHDV